jgi:general secretion pathway protein L
MRSLGIDIGRYSIKVVEVFASNRRYEVTKCKEYKVHNTQTSDQEIDILQTLNTIAKDFDTDTAKVTSSIRQQYVSTRKLFFPFKERVKIQKSLAFELEDDIPLSIDKAVYDSKILSFRDKSTEVMAMACISEEIEKTLDIMTRAHIDPDIITPELAALANLYEDFTKAPPEIKEDEEISEDKLVIHIGHSKTILGVVRKGALIWGRSIMWGAEKVAGSISQNFQVPFSTAHEMMPEKSFVLLTPGTASKDQLKMSEAVASAFAPLLQAARLTIMLANTEYGANVQSIELLGGPSKIKNIAAFFTQELEKTTNAANPLQSLRAQGLSRHQELDDVYQLALGLALEGCKRPINPPINFRQMQFAKKNLNFEKFWEKWGYTAKIVAIGYFCFMIYGIAIDSVATQLEEVSNDVLLNQASKVARLKGRSATPRKIRRYIKDNYKKAEMVKLYDQLEEINSPLKFLNEVSQILPPNKENQDYEVRRFFVNHDEINIQGVATNDKIIQEIRKSLKSIAVAQKVTLVPATILREEGKKMFGFKFNVRRKN